MLFNSPIYILIFLPVVVTGYYGLSRYCGEAPRNLWLLAASLFFYAYWKPGYLILLLASILINYALVVSMKGRPARGETRWNPRLLALLAGIVLNLGLLGYYKYAGFFVANVNDFLGTAYPPISLVLPLAISFFTFQQMAYLVDSYRGISDDHGLVDYGLFVTFFPQLIAGPIVHHREMMPQFQAEDSGAINWKHILVGAFVFAVGLFKKAAIADTFAIWADAGFGAEYTLGMLEAWGTCLSYSFQIYFDFSGYTDMAVGAALMLNIRLPLNFNSPYKALSIQDFWRRWHMTLSRWLRDYVYVPLGGNRHGLVRTYLAVLLTFVLGGLWHGAGWTFILWGTLHGLAVAGHRIWVRIGFRLPTVPAWLLTFGFVSVTWVFFRATDLDSAFRLLMSLFDVSSISLSMGFRDQLAQLLPGLVAPYSGGATPHVLVSEWVLVGALLALLITTTRKNSTEMMEPYLVGGAKVRLPAFIYYAVTAAIGITLLFASSSTTFLYFNF